MTRTHFIAANEAFVIRQWWSDGSHTYCEAPIEYVSLDDCLELMQQHENTVSGHRVSEESGTFENVTHELAQHFVAMNMAKACLDDQSEYPQWVLDELNIEPEASEEDVLAYMADQQIKEMKEARA